MKKINPDNKAEEPEVKYRKSKKEKDILDELTPEQLKSLEKGRADVKSGKFILNKEGIEKVKQWLTK